MKILQVTPHYIPAVRFGGPLRVAHGLAKSLAQMGHDVTVCTTSLKDESNDLAVELDVPLPLDGCSVFYEPISYSRYWGYSPKLRRRVAAEVKRADVVIIHSYFQYAGYVGARLAREFGKPYIVFPHSSLLRTGIQHKSRWIKAAYLATFERKTFENSLFVAFNAAEERKGSLFSSHGEVIPNGIDPEDFALRPPVGSFRDSYPALRDKRLFLFLGRLDIQQKGIDFLLPAFADLLRTSPECHLVIAGPDEEGGAQFIRRRTKELSIESSVTCVGTVAGQEKIGLFQDADAFVMSSRFEGLSIALLEALYFGLPVCTTSTVGLSDELRESDLAVVVEPSLAGVTRALREMADDNVRKRLVGRGTEFIKQRFTWEAIATYLMEQIHSHIGEREVVEATAELVAK